MYSIKKNKIAFKLALFMLITVFLIIFSREKSIALAAEPPKSTVNVEFKEGSGGGLPLDPDNPEIPPNGGGDAGPFVLEHVSDFDFDKPKVSTYTEYHPSITKKPFIQVTDLRGTYAGWSVVAKASEFKNDAGVTTLKGSSITLGNAQCVSPADEVEPPIPVSPVEIIMGGETVDIVSAKKNSGMGTWLTKWFTDDDEEDEFNHSVILTVPGGSGWVGVNTAIITWTLQDVPF